MGLSGCVMLASGVQVWVHKREQRIAQAGLVSVYGLVPGLNVGVVAGLPLACTVTLIANRLLPVALPQRVSMEIAAFCVM